MTVYYVDPVNGNDSNNGQSFANRRRTYPSNVSGEHEVRFIETPSTVSTATTARWIDRSAYVPQKTAAIYSFTAGTPISMSSNNNSHGFQTGDWILPTSTNSNVVQNVGKVWKITKTDNSNFTLDGSSGTTSYSTYMHTRNLTGNQCVVLDTVQTADLFGCQWLQSDFTDVYSNNSLSYSTNTNNGYQNPHVTGFYHTYSSTGTFMVYQLPSTLDLSDFDGIQFMLRTNTTSSNASRIKVNLCSDTAGQTVVNTFSFPNVAYGNKWFRHVEMSSGSLGSSINSITFSCSTATGSNAYYYVEGIQAIKDGGLNLYSLISPDPTSYGYYAIREFAGTDVFIAGGPYQNPGYSQSYCAYTGADFASGSDLYVIQAHIYEATNNPWNPQHSLGQGSSATARLQISGGWNTTDMSTRTGVSAIGYNGQYGHLLGGYTIRNTDLEHFVCVFMSSFIYCQSTIDNVNLDIRGCICSGDSTNGMTPIRVNNGYQGPPLGDVYVDYHNGNYGPRNVHNPNPHYVKWFQGANALAYNAPGKYLGNVSSGKASVGGITNPQHGVVLKDLDISGSIQAYTPLDIYAEDCDASFVFYNFGGQRLFSKNLNGTNPPKVQFGTAGYAELQSTIVNTTGGQAWMFRPTSTSYCTEAYPLELRLAQVAYDANSQVTVTAYMRRNSTGLNMQLLVHPELAPVSPYREVFGSTGVSTKTSVNYTGAVNTWVQVTLTFTPSEAGVGNIYARVWGGFINTGYIDDLAITQA
jgi:hypothetical protein